MSAGDDLTNQSSQLGSSFGHTATADRIIGAIRDVALFLIGVGALLAIALLSNNSFVMVVSTLAITVAIAVAFLTVYQRRFGVSAEVSSDATSAPSAKLKVDAKK
jgi:hypothetical protein